MWTTIFQTLQYETTESSDGSTQHTPALVEIHRYTSQELTLLPKRIFVNLPAGNYVVDSIQEIDFVNHVVTVNVS